MSEPRSAAHTNRTEDVSGPSLNFRMMAKIIALIGYDLSFRWAIFCLRVCECVSTRCRLVIVPAFNSITQAQSKS